VRFRHVASTRAEPTFAMREFDVLFVIDGLRHLVGRVKILSYCRQVCCGCDCGSGRSGTGSSLTVERSASLVGGGDGKVSPSFEVVMSCLYSSLAVVHVVHNWYCAAC